MPNIKIPGGYFSQCLPKLGKIFFVINGVDKFGIWNYLRDKSQ